MLRINHHEFVNGLSAHAKARLQRRRDLPGLIRLAVQFALLVANGYVLCALAPYLGQGLVLVGYAALTVLQGFCLVFMFTALHEFIHGTAFRTGWLNKALAFVAGLIVFVAPIWFRYFHFEHHRHTHDPARDPEIVSPKPATFVGHCWYLTGLTETGSRLRTIVANATTAAVGDFVPQNAVASVRVEARLFWFVYLAIVGASVWFDNDIVWRVWLLPYVVGGPFLRAYLLAEHTGCEHGNNMLSNTRTTYTSGWLRWFAWNMPYHAEHHALPTVPFHQLPMMHRLVRPHLAATQPGYIAFNLAYLLARWRGEPIERREFLGLTLPTQAGTEASER